MELAAAAATLSSVEDTENRNYYKNNDNELLMLNQIRLGQQMSDRTNEELQLEIAAISQMYGLDYTETDFTDSYGGGDPIIITPATKNKNAPTRRHSNPTKIIEEGEEQPSKATTARTRTPTALSAIAALRDSANLRSLSVLDEKELERIATSKLTKQHARVAETTTMTTIPPPCATTSNSNTNKAPKKQRDVVQKLVNKILRHQRKKQQLIDATANTTATVTNANNHQTLLSLLKDATASSFRKKQHINNTYIANAHHSRDLNNKSIDSDTSSLSSSKFKNGDTAQQENNTTNASIHSDIAVVDDCQLEEERKTEINVEKEALYITHGLDCSNDDTTLEDVIWSLSQTHRRRHSLPSTATANINHHPPTSKNNNQNDSGTTTRLSHEQQQQPRNNKKVRSISLLHTKELHRIQDEKKKKKEEHVVSSDSKINHVKKDSRCTIPKSEQQKQQQQGQQKKKKSDTKNHDTREKRPTKQQGVNKYKVVEEQNISLFEQKLIEDIQFRRHSYCNIVSRNNDTNGIMEHPFHNSESKLNTATPILLDSTFQPISTPITNSNNGDSKMNKRSLQKYDAGSEEDEEPRTMAFYTDH